MGLFDDLIKGVRDSLRNDVNELLKDDTDKLPDNPEMDTHSGAIGKKAIIHDPFFDHVSNHYIFKSKMSRLSNQTLKDTSVRDWLVSAIIQARIDTMLRFARPQHKQFEMGFRVFKRNKVDNITPEERKEIAALESFIYHCGRTDKVPPDDRMLFGEFLKLTTRDALTFGHIAIEKVLTRNGGLHRFRPLTAESVYLINQKTSREIIKREIKNARTMYSKYREQWLQNNDPESKHVYNEPKIDYYKYVQMSADGQRVLAAFGDEDMIWQLANPQNFADSMGYCYLPGTAHVLLENGETKLVEEICAGDRVVSHDSTFNKVTELKHRNVTDETVLTISPHGMMSHVVTGEHPMLIANKSQVRSWEHKKCKYGVDEDIGVQWVSAKDVKEKDYVAIPKLRFEERFTTIDMAKYGDVIEGEYVVANNEQNCPQHRVNRHIAVDADLGWLLGMYLGDGCLMAGGTTVRIDLGIHETNLVDRLVSILKNKFNIEVNVHSESERNYTGVYIGSKVFCNMVKDLCPGNTYSKRVSKCLFHAPLAVREAIIAGHIDSDGSVYTNGDGAAGSKSSQLIFGLAALANSIGVLAKVKEYHHRGGYDRSDRVSPDFRIQYPRHFIRNMISSEKAANISGDTYKMHYRQDSKFFYVRITSIGRKVYSGPVYNFEVENTHSYTVNQVATHNCYSALELAIINVTSHLNVENYNSQFFTHGYAAKGILHLKGTVTQAQMTAFRRQFYNTISGTQHAWRTPIIAGLDDVQWVPLSGSAREMEYLNFNNHIMRALCTQFQIDPVELGLDYLASPTGRSPMQQANNEYKITYSRERGLYPLLMMYEDMINSKIIPALDKRLAEKYEFKFVGYTDETAQSNVALLQAEMTVYSTMNDLLKSAGKEKVQHPAFDVPLNETFWNLVERNMTRGEIRAHFFGDKSALNKRELAYIPGDAMFSGWNQLLMTMDRTRRQDKLEAEQIKAQQEQEQQASQREQEQHDLAMDEAKSRNAQAAVQHKSLKEEAKEVGAASEPLNVGGTSTANPLNSPEAEE